MPCIKIREIPGWIQYYAGEDGNIYSVKSGKMRRLSPAMGTKGYKGVALCKNGVPKRFEIHKLIATVFLGPCPPGMEVCHGVKGKLDNSPENLSYGTRSKNMLDKNRDGTDPRGERHGNATLTNDTVLLVRELYSSGVRQCDIVAALKITQSNVSRIVNKKRWSHL